MVYINDQNTDVKENEDKPKEMNLTIENISENEDNEDIEVISSNIPTNESKLLQGGDLTNDEKGDEKGDEKEEDSSGKEDEDNTISNIIGGGKKKDTESKMESSDPMNVMVDIVYTIDYLQEGDDMLINVENVTKKVDKYIDNYNSIQMINYKKNFAKLYQKYSNKKYIIKHTIVKNSNNNTIKIVVVKNDKKQDNVYELVKPQYLFYNDNCNLQSLKTNISNVRQELLYKYEILVAKLNVTPDEKTEFEKNRNEFIQLLEEYYIYTLYHKKINKININNKSNIMHYKQKDIYNESENKYNQILDGNLCSIDKNIVLTINKINSDKLTQYNKIMLNLTGKDQKDIVKDKTLKEEIKLYIDRKEYNTIDNTIKIISEQQDKYIDYIVISLPS